MINIEENVTLAQFTTFGIGGPAKFLVKAKNQSEILEAITWSKDNKQAFIIIGGGSNLLISDEGFPGLVIIFKGGGYKFNGTKLIADGSAFTALLALKSRENNLGGLEFASGIPGTIGGAVVGNAGAYGMSISDILISAKIWHEDKIKNLKNSDFHFGYRSSEFKHQNDAVVIEVAFDLSTKPKLKQEDIENDKAKRAKDYIGSNAGSYFKNISVQTLSEKNIYMLKPFILHGKVSVGKIIESLGLKGYKIGGAEVSMHHGNVLVNTGTASANDIIKLEEKIAKSVKEQYDIILEPEVVKIGF